MGAESRCENSGISPSAAEAALNVEHLRHGFSRAVTKSRRCHTDSLRPSSRALGSVDSQDQSQRGRCPATGSCNGKLGSALSGAWISVAGTSRPAAGRSDCQEYP